MTIHYINKIFWAIYYGFNTNIFRTYWVSYIKNFVVFQIS